MGKTGASKEKLPYRCAYDWGEVLDGRVVFVTGVGRSGTTIFSKLLSSMAPALYFDEPMLFNFFPLESSIPAIFYDDYVQRGIGQILERGPGALKGLNREFKSEGYPNTNRGILQFIKDVRPVIVVKLINSQPYISRYSQLFPGIRILHIVRNGLDVIKSAAFLDWYCDGETVSESRLARITTGPFNEMVHSDLDCNVPWYIPREEVGIWKDSDTLTRLAHSWSVLVQSQEVDLTYEDMCKNPSSIAASLSKTFDMQATDRTKAIIEDITNHKPRDYAWFNLKTGKKQSTSISDIGKPIREKFEVAMDKMQYKIKGEKDG